MMITTHLCLTWLKISWGIEYLICNILYIYRLEGRYRLVYLRFSILVPTIPRMIGSMAAEGL